MRRSLPTRRTRRWQRRAGSRGGASRHQVSHGRNAASMGLTAQVACTEVLAPGLEEQTSAQQQLGFAELWSCVAAGVIETPRGGHEWDGCEEADARTRTGDPFITSEVLYQLSYVGGAPTVAVDGRRFRSASSLGSCRERGDRRRPGDSRTMNAQP